MYDHVCSKSERVVLWVIAALFLILAIFFAVLSAVQYFSSIVVIMNGRNHYDNLWLNFAIFVIVSLFVAAVAVNFATKTRYTSLYPVYHARESLL